MNLKLHEYGHIEASFAVGNVIVTEAFYPLCGDAVQTEARAGPGEVRLRPDAYTRPVKYD